MKYDVDNTYSSKNIVKITTSQTGSKAMIRMKNENTAMVRQGFRVCAEFEGEKETVWCGEWKENEVDSLKNAVKYEYYKAKAYKELYFDLVQKLNNIGLYIRTEDDEC